MAHTPGPWKAKKSFAGFLDIQADTVSLAGIFPVENAEANAILMAAAPQLLETLAYLVAEIEATETEEDLAILATGYAIQQARAALVAARGEGE